MIAVLSRKKILTICAAVLCLSGCSAGGGFGKKEQAAKIPCKSILEESADAFYSAGSAAADVKVITSETDGSETQLSVSVKTNAASGASEINGYEAAVEDGKEIARIPVHYYIFDTGNGRYEIYRESDGRWATHSKDAVHGVYESVGVSSQMYSELRNGYAALNAAKDGSVISITGNSSEPAILSVLGRNTDEYVTYDWQVEATLDSNTKIPVEATYTKGNKVVKIAYEKTDDAVTVILPELLESEAEKE